MLKSFLGACALAAALLAALPASAATFKIAFDQASTGVGDDWFGTFSAPAGGGAVTSFQATINGILYDTEASLGAVGVFSPVYIASSGVIASAATSWTFFTEDVLTAKRVPALFIGSRISQPTFWSIGTCTIGACGWGFDGTYTISEYIPPPSVPLPAGLPLLAGGLGLLGLMRRRRG